MVLGNLKIKYNTFSDSFEAGGEKSMENGCEKDGRWMMEVDRLSVIRYQSTVT
jgi:hypothetical protein